MYEEIHQVPIIASVDGSYRALATACQEGLSAEMQ